MCCSVDTWDRLSPTSGSEAAPGPGLLANAAPGTLGQALRAAGAVLPARGAFAGAGARARAAGGAQAAGVWSPGQDGGPKPVTWENLVQAGGVGCNLFCFFQQYRSGDVSWVIRPLIAMCSVTARVTFVRSVQVSLPDSFTPKLIQLLLLLFFLI